MRHPTIEEMGAALYTARCFNVYIVSNLYFLNSTFILPLIDTFKMASKEVKFIDRRTRSVFPETLECFVDLIQLKIHETSAIEKPYAPSL